MLVRAKSGEYLLDPHGVFLAPGEGQPLFRVLAVQKFKTLGVRLVGCFEGTDVDVLQDRRNGHKVVLTEEGDPGKSILVLATQPVPGNMLPVTRAIRKMVRDVENCNITGMISDSSCGPGNVSPPALDSMPLTSLTASMLMATTATGVRNTVMIFNESKLDVTERSRLYVRRFGYCDSNQFPRMNAMIEYGDMPKLCPVNEDSVVKDAAKFRRKSQDDAMLAPNVL